MFDGAQPLPRQSVRAIIPNPLKFILLLYSYLRQFLQVPPLFRSSDRLCKGFTCLHFLPQQTASVGHDLLINEDS